MTSADFGGALFYAQVIFQASKKRLKTEGKLKGKEHTGKIQKNFSFFVFSLPFSRFVQTNTKKLQFFLYFQQRFPEIFIFHCKNDCFVHAPKNSYFMKKLEKIQKN